MRNSEKRSKRSRSSNSESEGEERYPKNYRRRNHDRHSTRLEKDSDAHSSASLLTLTLIAALGASSSVIFHSDLSKMNSYANSNNQIGPMDYPQTGYKPRAQKLRYRDDEAMLRALGGNKPGIDYGYNNEPMMMMPVVTERQRPTNHHLRPMLSPTTSRQRDNSDMSVEDMEVIDFLWRNDIAVEKGDVQLDPNDQHERDLQLLTEKSAYEQLTTSENARFENLAKGFYADFFSNVNTNFKGNNDMENERSHTPTDKELKDLFDDMTTEGGQLDQLCMESPIINNVTLGQGIVYNSDNVTDLATYEIPACSPPISEGELFSNGTMDSPTWPQQRNMGPNDIFPAGPQDTIFPIFPQNVTAEPIISTGVHFNHSYTNQIAPSNSVDMYDSNYYVPNGMSYSNESSSVCSSSTNSRSPTYLSETENMPPASRYFGKLAPNPTEFSAQEKEEKDDDSSSAPRRRGRQSKDEQLAKTNGLPLSAKEIAEMSLADLQKMLKSENLTEQQKALVKKIRRRGKNKVAARTCRQRRGDRMQKATQDHWDQMTAHELEASE